MYRFETLQVHAGFRSDPATGAITVPIFQSNAYEYASVQQAADRFALKDGGYIYTRLGNPTTDVLEQRMCALEGGVGALAASSGHGAEMLAFMTLLNSGDHVVASGYIYGGTVNILTHTLPRYGIETTFVNPDDPENFAEAIKENTKLIFLEQLGNPLANIVDVRAVSKIARANGIPLMVDNTFATPYLYRPFEHGADIVLHSSTKYINGHGNSMGGVLIDSGNFDWEASGKFPGLTQPDDSYHGVTFTKDFGKAAFIVKARVSLMRDIGACPSPFNSYMMLMGLETLSLRMKKVVENTREVISFLSKHPGVDWVKYPELKDSPYFELAKRDFPGGCSGVFVFGIKGGAAAGAKFIDNLKLLYNASNLADSHSMVVHPASTTHSQLSEEALREAGLSPEMVRVSIGLEDAQDIIEDIDQAINAALK